MIDLFDGEFRWLSNFHVHHEIEYNHLHDGMKANTVEHLYQACKVLHYHDVKIILDAETPGQAKRLGSKFKMIPNWDATKVVVMRDLIKLKFKTNTILAEKLICTDDHFIVEGNKWGDTFWGVCDGRGRNVLGQLIMERRDFLQNNTIMREL